MCGAFISNELSREQMSLISRPERFDLYYSVYHPLLLLTSRQCLLHQIEGCEKSRIGIFKNADLGTPLRSTGFENCKTRLEWCILAYNLWKLTRMAAQNRERAEQQQAA